MMNPLNGIVEPVDAELNSKEMPPSLGSEFFSQ